MNNEKNWFRVNRSLLFSDRWLSEPFTRGQAWVDLFGLAQHKSGHFRIRGIKVEVNRGQLAYSKKTLAERWKWSRGKVDRWFAELEEEGDIVQKNVQQNGQQIKYLTTIITVVKYDLWQGNGQQNGHQTDTKRDIYKNVKNVKNISEQSSVTSNNKDMTFNKYNDDVSTIDYDSNELVEEETTKVNTETKERNKKIRHNIRYAFTALELKQPDPKQVNWQLKHYQTLLDRGWSHEQIVENFIHIVGSDHWREKMDNGENPGFHTVEYTLRSKDPEKYVIKS